MLLKTVFTNFRFFNIYQYSQNLILYKIVCFDHDQRSASAIAKSLNQTQTIFGKP